MEKSEGIEFNLLGCRVRRGPAVEGQIDPGDAVNMVQSEALAMKKKNPNRADTEIAVLVALKLAADNMILESEYKTNIDKLQNSVSDALQFIDEVSPTTA